MYILSLLIILTFNASAAREPAWKYICRNTNYMLQIRDFDDAKNITTNTKLLILTKLKDGKIAYCLGKDSPSVRRNDYDCTPPARALLADESIRLNYISIKVTADGKNSELVFEETGKEEIRKELTCESIKNPV